MIRFASKTEGEQIATLWNEAFGDSREWVMMYLRENIDNVLIYEHEGEVMGMLSLLPVSYNDDRGYYVYGVATKKACRSCGISSRLLDYAKALVSDGGFLVLVPRNQELFNFYKNRGFSAVYAVTTKKMQKDELLKYESGVKVFPASCKEYYNIRKNRIKNLIEWDEQMLCSIKKFENGEYYKNEKGEGAFCYAYLDKLYIKELCGDLGLAAAISKKYDVESVIITVPERCEVPSCMTYPEMPQEILFNISID